MPKAGFSSAPNSALNVRAFRALSALVGDVVGEMTGGYWFRSRGDVLALFKNAPLVSTRRRDEFVLRTTGPGDEAGLERGLLWVAVTVEVGGGDAGSEGGAGAGAAGSAGGGDSARAGSVGGGGGEGERARRGRARVRVGEQRGVARGGDDRGLISSTTASDASARMMGATAACSRDGNPCTVVCRATLADGNMEQRGDGRRHAVVNGPGTPQSDFFFFPPLEVPVH